MEKGAEAVKRGHKKFFAGRSFPQGFRSELEVSCICVKVLI